MKNNFLLTIALFLSVNFAFAQARQDRKVAHFTSIEAGGVFKIFLRMGDKSAVTVVADEKIINDVKTTVKNGELELELENSWWENNNVGTLEVYITVTNLTSIDISGACQLVTKNTITGNQIDIEASGASQITGTFSYSAIDVEISGAAQFTAHGKCGKLNIDASGASNLNAADLQSKSIVADASGASNLKINATDIINIDASGASVVKYKGAATVNKEISGAANVSAM